MDNKKVFYKIKKYTEKLKQAKNNSDAEYFHRKLRYYHRVNQSSPVNID